MDLRMYVPSLDVLGYGYLVVALVLAPGSQGAARACVLKVQRLAVVELHVVGYVFGQVQAELVEVAVGQLEAGAAPALDLDLDLLHASF